MTRPSTYSYSLTPDQQERLQAELQSPSYAPMEVAHTRIAARKPGVSIALYTSGKCVVQGREAQDWVTYTLEPDILREVRLGYEHVHHPEWYEPHMGVDESGKGDFFGPLVIAAAHVTREDVDVLTAAGIRDSKRVGSDAVIGRLAKVIREQLGQRFVIVEIGPEAYNRLYASFGNVNRLLAWGHATAIENLLDRVPDCPRAVADQFGPKHRILSALKEKGRRIDLHQQPRAEEDPAVAAASILARDRFVTRMGTLGGSEPLPKGASDRVRARAVDLVRRQGPEALRSVAKLHFKTADAVYAEAGVAPPEARA